MAVGPRCILHATACTHLVNAILVGLLLRGWGDILREHGMRGHGTKGHGVNGRGMRGSGVERMSMEQGDLEQGGCGLRSSSV